MSVAQKRIMEEVLTRREKIKIKCFSQPARFRIKFKSTLFIKF